MVAAKQFSGIASLLLGFSLEACDFAEPNAEDPTPILGCYTAPNAPTFRLGKNGMQTERSQTPVPFRYENRKVGYVVDVPLSANDVRGRLKFSVGDQNFYRVIWSDGRPVIIVAYGPEVSVVNYNRSSQVDCF